MNRVMFSVHRLTVFVLTMALLVLAADLQAGPPKNEYPIPGKPVSSTSELPPDDTIFMLTPSPDFGVESGYAGYGDNKGYKSGLGIGVVVFLDTGRLGLQLQGSVAGGEGGVFAYAEGALKARFRMPVDSKHIFWWGWGADIEGRGAEQRNVDSYLRLQPVAMIGTMFQVKETCVVHIFARAGLGIIDNENQSHERWDWPRASAWGATWGKPSTGVEMLTHCNKLRVTADYQHIFALRRSAGGTDRTGVQISQGWKPTSKNVLLGIFGKTEFVREGGVEDLPVADPRRDARYLGRFMAGFEARF